MRAAQEAQIIIVRGYFVLGLCPSGVFVDVGIGGMREWFTGCFSLLLHDSPRGYQR